MIKKYRKKSKFEWGMWKHVIEFDVVESEVLTKYPSVCIHQINENTKLSQF